MLSYWTVACTNHQNPGIRLSVSFGVDGSEQLERGMRIARVLLSELQTLSSAEALLLVGCGSECLMDGILYRLTVGTTEPTNTAGRCAGEVSDGTYSERKF